jgi:hypothetical protein
MVRSAAVVFAFCACSPTLGAVPGSDAADDAQCATQPALIAIHPYAIKQPTPTGQDLEDTRGFGGRLYFGYGDLGANTGPIEITGYDPVANQWIDNFNYLTHRIIRYEPIGNALWVPSGQPMMLPGQDYAVATATNDWGSGGINVGTALHVVEAVERVPGDIYLTGEDFFGSDLTSAAVWRSQNGGPFTEIFPDAGSVPEEGNNQVNSWFFNAAALDGILYVDFGWIFDGTTWSHPATDLGSFQRPTTFAGHIVTTTLGELWAFDGTTLHDLHVALFPSTGIEQTTVAPYPLYEVTEGRLLAIDDTAHVRMTTDLAHWTCLGEAPPDVRSVGSLNGTIYFGGAAGRVYGYAAPSW